MKRALVISGGGSRGSFAVGAASYLMEALGQEFDIFAGTSTGALITPLLAAGGAAALPQLRREYTTVRTSDIIKDRWKEPWRLIPLTSLYLTSPLRRRVEAGLPADVLERIERAGKQLFLATVDLASGHIVYFHTGAPVATDNGEQVRLSGRGQLVDAMVASSSIPFFMPPQEIAARGEKKDSFVDGGVREYAPISIAIDAGADEIVCVVLMPPPKLRPASTHDYRDIVNVLRTTIDLLSQEVGESDVRMSRLYSDAIVYVDGVRARLKAELPGEAARIDAAFDAPAHPFRGRVAVRLTVIRPERMLLGETLKFDPAQMTANMLYGCERAQAAFPGGPADFCAKLKP